MPKYLVTSGTTFQPFTYDQMVKPLQQMAEAHRASQDVYDQISLETNALRNYITDNPDDAQAKAMYDSYVQKLDTLQNNLWNNGYNAQTRRDLSAARAGYASDITRLGKAVKDRQERSAAYWKTRHDHPDMIMGADPGLSGLDNYLNNDLFGQDYYSYSGDAFTAEVGADAKARVKEMVRNPEIMKDPTVAGYITRIDTEGFTSQEVAAAGSAVRAALAGNPSALSALDPASGILANVLLSHLDSTGAKDNVSDDEFARLVEYGISGLSQAIGDTKLQDFSDKIWDRQQDWNDFVRKQEYLASHPTGGGGSGSGSGSGYGTDWDNRGYTIQDISTFLKSKEQEDAAAATNKYFEEPFKEPAITSTGDVIADPMDADRILAGFGRQNIMGRFGGIDPLNPTVGTGKMLSGQNGSVEVRVVKKPAGTTYAASGVVDMRKTITDADGHVIPAGIVYDYTVQTKGSNGKWENSEPLTAEFNESYEAFQEQLNQWQQANPDVNLSKLAVTRKERKKIAKENGISENVPLQYVHDILDIQGDVRRSTPATIAAATEDMKSTRDNYRNQIISAYTRAKSSQKKISNSDKISIHKIVNGSPQKKATPIDNVFGKNDVIREIIVYPEDLKNNRVRVSVGNKDSAGESSVYLMNPALLGNGIDIQIQKMTPTVLDTMLPLLDPSKAVTMSPEEERAWVRKANDFIGDILPLAGRDEDGNFVMVRPRDIVTTPQLQEALRNAVRISMNELLAVPRDSMGQENMQVRGNTSSKAEEYNQ